ncbi:hypothetical protein AN639_06205 [Candidatus Epulonipiscium fishelsonii]|uniref:Uncharacterized protein n=1 Tax=Candidatus Epulonipiscium fishelsonii TaxID=77094 RepID=A0ACC8X9W3_9FIRM|nr:hypothetical protein AN396_09740 [Epulopiscium sp. SCG-B11WGA-EpuloA1]ONI39339.1 hypothetical protein AN639_06205 [Epulopiscium sp. SCG-B05WGA-EpuloA1]ONI46901.1 hypothetical protein AN644_02220 [Epulopiscium sp. SCG-C06WGA-EpuloA1]
MDNLKFKSLSRRIWYTLVILSVFIIFTISIIYNFVINSLERNYVKEILLTSHTALLSEVQQVPIFEQEVDIKDLIRVNHLLVNVDNGNINVFSFNRKFGISPNEFEQIKQEIPNIINSDEIYQFSINDLHINEQIYTISTYISDNSYLVSYVKSITPSFLQFEVIAISLAFTFCSFWIAKHISNYICKPLKGLEEHALKIANHQFTEPLIAETNDEIGSLINSINYMQDELYKKEEQEKRFLQTISHDLKTPIMIISGHAQAIIDEMYIESLEETAQIIVDEAKRLETKVTQMLYFNTLDITLQKSLHVEQICLNEMLSYIITKFQVLNKSINWDINLEENLYVKANREQLEIAIENIFDNQLRYVQNVIRTYVYKDKFIHIIIGNDGENIPPNKIEKIFDHLYKDNQGKFGLGLAITKKIVCHYRGSIEVSNSSEGVNFHITFPISV